VLRIAGMCASGRGRIKFQAGVVERFETDAGGVETDDRVPAEQAEKLLPGFFCFPLMGFVSEPFEEGLLLGGSQLEKRRRWFRGMIEPLQTLAEFRLQRWVAEHHEIDEFGDAGFAGPRLRLAGSIMRWRQYELCDLFNRLILARREKLRTILGLQGVLFREGMAPAGETRKSGGCRSQGKCL
jgi:hypothetical protein